ncbi:MAG: hypothetical protein R3Y13_02630 [bacterium]
MNVDVEAKVLLDKLYNLRSKDSVILFKIDNERQQTEATKNRTADEKLVITEKVKELNDEEVLLAKEGELLKDALKNINRESFTVVFKKLNIDFDPKYLSEKVESVLPNTISQVKTEILESNKKLESVVKEMNDAITKIDELAIRRDEAKGNQSKLSEYIDLAIDGNINITRDALTTLLSKFDLTDAEQRECAKLLMFPEDGLYEYEERFNKKNGKSFSDVFADAKTLKEEEVKPVQVEAPVKPITLETPKEVRPITFEVPAKKEEVSPIKIDFPTPAAKKEEESKQPKPIMLDDFLVVKPENKKDVDVSALLTSKGFKVIDFSATDIKFIEDNYNEVVFEKNVNLIEELGLNNDIFNDNVELFVDSELEEKLNTLLNVGKVPFDIYLNPVVLVKYDVKELISSIDSLKSSGLDPKKVPLMAF